MARNRSRIPARHVCGLAGDWTMAEFRETKIAEIREQVGVGPNGGKVICGLGGVDSAVAAVLIHEAIGEQLTCVFVDHGLLRANEREQVEGLFRGAYNIPAGGGGCGRALPVRPCRRNRPGKETQVHRQDLHRRVRGGSAEDRRADFLARARCIPTSSRASASPAGRASRSRAITMSAACPSG